MASLFHLLPKFCVGTPTAIWMGILRMARHFLTTQSSDQRISLRSVPECLVFQTVLLPFILLQCWECLELGVGLSFAKTLLLTLLLESSSMLIQLGQHYRVLSHTSDTNDSLFVYTIIHEILVLSTEN